jgi:tetratricopeptide (TPR) repeat protein
MRLPLIPLLLAALAPSLSAQTTARGVQLFDAHDRTGARAELTAAVRQNDGDARAHYYLGRLAMLQNDADAAAAHFERAVKLEATVSDYHFWYASAVAQQTSRASTLKQPILARRMKAAVERAVALDERNIDARDLLVDFHSMAPGFMGGSREKAQEHAAAIARIDTMRGHLAAARLAAQAKDSAAVVREMNAAIAAAPDSLRAYAALATWYATAKVWPQAFATVDRYIARRPDDLHGSYHVGRIAALSGEQLPRGERAIREFIATPPKDAPPPLVSRAHLRLGQILEHQGKRAEARGAFEQAIALDPRNEDAKKALKGGGR